ncbi:hypothetical protein FNFX1_0884 [Francisella cf. novicida Fx1]|uniref:hypothetical protein n=1 Tax=Francisella tularensis TaxID=263 RepID=UPI00020591DA|nr:hypothetical protein [Francisella tularensis]AEB27832.1 hypothetical protein FNFX1_0884 [Francisella cf. novicida Fx1]
MELLLSKNFLAIKTIYFDANLLIINDNNSTIRIIVKQLKATENPWLLIISK